MVFVSLIKKNKSELAIDAVVFFTENQKFSWSSESGDRRTAYWIALLNHRIHFISNPGWRFSTWHWIWCPCLLLFVNARWSFFRLWCHLYSEGTHWRISRGETNQKCFLKMYRTKNISPSSDAAQKSSQQSWWQCLLVSFHYF